MSEFEQIREHLNELRSRVVRIALVIGIIIVFLLSFHLVPIQMSGIHLYYPTPDPMNNIAAQITNHMRIQLVPESVQLIQTAPGQAFYSQIYVAALVGLAFGMPIIIKEMVGFIKPALKESEIHVIRSISIPALVLFAAGCVFSYFFVIPYVLDFLYQYGQASGLVTFLNVIDFVTFVLQFLLAFGISFQLPLIMYAVSVAGLVDGKFWRGNARYAMVVIVIFGAAVTPDGSGVTMWFVSIPMMILYFIGMIVIERREHRMPKT